MGGGGKVDVRSEKKTRPAPPQGGVGEKKTRPAPPQGGVGEKKTRPAPPQGGVGEKKTRPAPPQGGAGEQKTRPAPPLGGAGEKKASPNPPQSGGLGLSANSFVTTDGSGNLTTATITNVNGCQLSIAPGGTSITASMTQDLTTSGYLDIDLIDVNELAATTQVRVDSGSDYLSAYIASAGKPTLLMSTGTQQYDTKSSDGTFSWIDNKANTVLQADKDGAYRTGTITNKTVQSNGTTTDTSVTSASFSHRFLTGACEEVFRANCSTTGPFSGSTSLTQNNGLNGSHNELYVSSGADGAWFETALGTQAAGVYKITYGMSTWNNRGKFNLSVKHSGSSSYTTVRSAYDLYTTTSNWILERFEDYITTTSSNPITIRWTANGKNGSSSNYYTPLAYCSIHAFR